MDNVLLEIKNLKKYYKTKIGFLQAVDNVSFSIEKGKTLGIVGESGCGKTTIGRTILRLIEPTSGQIFLEGREINSLSKRELRKMRKDFQIIFQDPFSSLDPRKTVSELIAEPIHIHKMFKTKKEVENKVKELMGIVGLAERLYDSYPHELDGGRRQRIGIARALSTNPKFIVCDEPVSALDVSIQAQILNILNEIQQKFGVTYIFITHDLSVVYYFSDDIAVMYLGQLVEKAPADELFSNPIHPYTKALLSAIPSIDIDKKIERIILNGEITSPINLPNECRFAKRCNHTFKNCLESDPKLKEFFPNHFVACHLCEKKELRQEDN
jgi:peptide/nickel transport system ATP-binding protein